MGKTSIQPRIGVDIGGTFTDVAMEVGGEIVTGKVLTTHTAPEQGVLAAIEAARSKTNVDPGSVGLIIHGTTLATNALIERKGAKTAFLTTDGFRDVLEMGTESRFDQYDLNIQKPAPLVPRHLRLPVKERLSVEGETLLSLDETSVDAAIEVLKREEAESVAIGFMHSWRHPAHEQKAAEIVAKALPDISISLSSEVAPEIREYERFSTACANAYVQPMMARYLGVLRSALAEEGYGCPLFLMHSGGGLMELEAAIRFPVRLVESGPAGGAILAADLAEKLKLDKVVSFDMGGTTAKICMIDDGRAQTARSFEVARAYRFKPGSGLPLRIPVIEMVEIGAGGGSIARVDALKRIQVGPDSAGSEPGPACYGRGGQNATITDANVVLGRIDPESFSGGTLALDKPAAEAAVSRDVGAALNCDDTAAAVGIVEIVDENMANAAREHAVERALGIEGRALIAFGGSAPLHAARIAQKLGLDKVIIPVSASVGSALGFLRAPVTFEVARTGRQVISRFDADAANTLLSDLSREALDVVERGAPGAKTYESRYAYMRYLGQGHEIRVPLAAGSFDQNSTNQLVDAYNQSYRDKYGRLIPDVDIEIIGWAVSIEAEKPTGVVGNGDAVDVPRPVQSETHRAVVDQTSGTVSQWPVFRRGALLAGDHLVGPAVVAEDLTTTIVPEGFEVAVDGQGNLHLDRTA